MGEGIPPVIQCGGAGKRLWPLSTGAHPKPFHPISDGTETLLQSTLRRMAPGPDTAFLAPVIICAEPHVDLVRRQMRAIKVRPAALVIEPEGRGTAAAAMLAAQAVREVAPGSLALLAPADHRIIDDKGFRRCVAEAGDEAADRIVLFAATADRPETGYGYIQIAPWDVGRSTAQVLSFVEKPDGDTARGLIEQGGWAWNAGLFLATPEILLAEIARHAPAVAMAASSAWDHASRHGVAVRPDAEAFAASPIRSLDRAVIEKSDRLAAASCDVGWADLGCWRAVWREGDHDPSGNQLKGPAMAVDSAGCLVWSSTVPVAVVGMSNVVVVTTPNGVLVMPRDRAQEVGRLSRHLDVR